jgi:hypothetical protein
MWECMGESKAPNDGRCGHEGERGGDDGGDELRLKGVCSGDVVNELSPGKRRGEKPVESEATEGESIHCGTGADARPGDMKPDWYEWAREPRSGPAERVCIVCFLETTSGSRWCSYVLYRCFEVCMAPTTEGGSLAKLTVERVDRLPDVTEWCDRSELDDRDDEGSSWSSEKCSSPVSSEMPWTRCPSIGGAAQSCSPPM